MKKLIDMQAELKAPKGRTNSFGGYKYRSCEDILEAVKPILKKYDCSLSLSDELKNIGDRYYIEAIAELVDNDNNERVTVTAFARETETKKGQDESQITGTASSYARKYALNGLFLIDDTKDSDSEEGIKEAAAKAEIEDRSKLRTGVQTAPIDEMLQVVSEYLESTKQLEKTLKAYKIERVADMTEPQLIAAYNVAIKTSNKGE